MRIVPASNCVVACKRRRGRDGDNERIEVVVMVMEETKK
jgi:hypothetical protein